VNLIASHGSMPNDALVRLMLISYTVKLAIALV
jgi:hypothetical protein